MQAVYLGLLEVSGIAHSKQRKHFLLLTESFRADSISPVLARVLMHVYFWSALTSEKAASRNVHYRWYLLMTCSGQRPIF